MLTLRVLLRDKLWRLNHLYWITDKEGKPVRFTMTPEQLEYFEGMHHRNIILKARQLGFTTSSSWTPRCLRLPDAP
ncbi:hypothetical protein GTPT_1830 [Tatumella ptyseos ATCC 33301]|uniref:Uncharacterized protein n=2 Tax=Tatumella ptyseos TaxID=82987 RepID=A0A085JG95_9GAMM|nr:hypothetical protein GTPT_1830 [Tatumella ptyseos ATCC 33301]SQK75437.1 Uncharacterised protein [Tatumella ptyseos]